MSETTDPQTQKTDDKPEYLKFIALLVVLLVAILAVAMLGPRLIGEVTPSVLGLGSEPAAQPAQAVDEEPAAESEPATESAAPETLVEPLSATAPEQGAPADGQAEVEAAVELLQHEVLPGQTLFQLAELYGVTVQEIAAANNLVNPLQLQAGTILLIPQPE
jgi:LysM repeat protein